MRKQPLHCGSPIGLSRLRSNNSDLFFSEQLFPLDPLECITLSAPHRKHPPSSSGLSTSLRPANPFACDEATCEPCERRLVLSAQLLLDVLAMSAPADNLCSPVEASAAGGRDASFAIPESSGAIHSHVESTAPQLQTADLPLESHLREAHAATGWNQVQQQFGLTGAGQTVAVIDSGIAWDHVALGGGYGPGYRVVGGWDFAENDAVPYDDGPAGFHGTHVAGIVGSSHAIHRGVAPDVDLVALRVFNDVGQGQLAWVEQALNWVYTHRDAFENPITTVNLSLGTTWNSDTLPHWAMLEDEFQKLANEGIVVVASAGNSFQQYQAPGLSYPAASPFVLPVASVGDDGQLSDFSQRNGRVLAAPGEQINSTVPDYVYGRDGIFNDFSIASGTSMAAPYVAGASVLVRQAMEMVGFDTINLSTISSHLRATADTIFDAVTGANYDRLNLANAIQSLIPSDTVGDTPATAATFDLSQNRLDGWINHLGDRDVYRFTTAASGTLQLDAHSQWADSLQWTLTTAGQAVATGGLDPRAVELSAGTTYELHVAAPHRIGGFSFDVDFTSSVHGGAGQGEGPATPVQSLGAIDYRAETEAAGATYHAQATRDGTFTVQWSNPDAAQGSLVIGVGGRTLSDATWEQGSLRLDVPVRAGDWLDISLPGSPTDTGELVLANVMSQAGRHLTVTGTLGSDVLAVDLQNGLKVNFGEIEYRFLAGQINQVHIDGYGDNDSLQVHGSSQSEMVELKPTGSTIENSQIRLTAASVEQISFTSGGGPDRVYMYDSDTDDTLTAYPRQAELVGVGYRFSVSDVDRIFVHATGGGNDSAYLYDSPSDDQLSVRPQFTSMSGDRFFNYVRGFERVYAYANAGGFDTADIYDSAGNDRFMTNGPAASIVGHGFASYTRSFEQVRAHAGAGGHDVAALYGTNQQTTWQRGSDFIGFQEQAWQREARGFGTVETYVAGQLQSLAGPLDVAVSAAATVPLATDSPPVTFNPAATASPPVQSDWQRADANEGPHSTELAKLQSEPLTDLAWEDVHAETQVLREAMSLREWLATHDDLPEEALLSDPDLELALLDEIFRQHEAL